MESNPSNSQSQNTQQLHPPSSQDQLPCRYLRSKEMYYQAPDDDEFAGGQFWCNRTMEAFGPDGEACGKKQCCANRTCYVT
ncbi:MAG TPA: hypothetical protein VNU68_03805 [Verrucomicrobiae bacterium]|jgi:hypothetical protein|nr:hypothetical protein [Verrucomicrobiae bacterium]